MAQSGRERHRDRDPGHRQWVTDQTPAPNRAFRMTDDQRQKVAKSLRRIDDARRVLEQQQNAANREIIRELRASADAIFDIINDLEETEP